MARINPQVQSKVNGLIVALPPGAGGVRRYYRASQYGGDNELVFDQSSLPKKGQKPQPLRDTISPSEQTSKSAEQAEADPSNEEQPRKRRRRRKSAEQAEAAPDHEEGSEVA